MKKLGYILTFLAVMTSLSLGQVRASEGKIDLTSDSSGAVCLGTSVFVEGRYRILFSCRGLEMAADPVYNRYMVWTRDEEGSLRRLGEIKNGKLQASVTDAFVGAEVSLESKTSPIKPSGRVVLIGEVLPFNFGETVESEDEWVGQPSTVDEQEEETVDDRGAVSATTTPSTASGFSKVLSGILKALLIGFVVIIVVVGASSYLSSRRKK